MALIPLPFVQAAPGANARMDAQALTAGTRALQSVAAGVQDVSDAVGAYAQRVQAAKDAADIARARNVMLSQEEGFKTWAATEQDTEKWTDAAEQRISTTRDVIGKLGLSPAAMRRVEVDLAEWEGKQRIVVEHMRLRQNAANADRTLQEATLAAADQGDLAAVESHIRQRQALGLIHESEAASIRRQMGQRADIMTANRAINVDPYTFAEQIDAKTEAGNWQYFKNLDDNQRLQLKREARQVIASVHEDTTREFQDRLNNGEKISQETFQQAVDSGRMTPQQMRNLMSQQRGTANYADSVVRMAELQRRITSLDPGKPDATAEMHNIAADMAGLPQSMRAPLETALRNQMDGDTKAGATSEAERWIDRMYSESFFGNVRTIRTGQENAGELADRAGYVQANNRVVELRAALARYMRDHPQAPADEQVAHLRKLIKADAVKAGGAATLNALTGRSQ